ncbi:hypothetical protein FPV67DRAFT_7867 [Lyophyllum atratum]|nr:hypothetical protein FPV67DRAFT_7867 [Lyophyllum atratum]
MQELLELLQKGELYNLGPDGNLIHAVPPSAGKGQPASVSTPLSSAATGKAPFNDLPPIDRPKTSKFKLSRANAGRPSGSSVPSDQSARTDDPVSMLERSSPKPRTTMASNVLERSSAQRPSTRTTPVTERSSPKPASATTPAVLERRPASTVNPTAATPAFPSMIVDSPSFSAPSAARMSSQTGATPAFSMTVDSPSFPKPQVPVPSQGSSRPSRPPTLVSSAVRESSRASPGNTTPDLPQARPGKVSRFMAERET